MSDTCATCRHIGVIYWDNGYTKNHHCGRSSERRRDNFQSSGDRADDFMSEFRKFYDAHAGQRACRYYEVAEALPDNQGALLAQIDAAGQDGLIVGFLSPENYLSSKLNGKLLESERAYPLDHNRGERRLRLTKVGRARLPSPAQTPPPAPHAASGPSDHGISQRSVEAGAERDGI